MDDLNVAQVWHSSQRVYSILAAAVFYTVKLFVVVWFLSVVLLEPVENSIRHCQMHQDKSHPESESHLASRHHHVKMFSFGADKEEMQCTRNWLLTAKTMLHI